ncbi:NAD-dependent dehydratase [Candidatus Uhrbacteria bacterium RIFCSPHIGHO2_02_FULL_53_13]|uniref:NAD-dependent dehydratase n=1 Tax=Candidatus Uhrbacteria bacterium RIFCSPHIGHO2_02_FULL_53_13 TaxID=1802389 RepID=A0A1F7TYP2_9BACT|nr:MAG: NAD-dependent dehydratase [Candidatus Uhrbacteria bacterium RIFCSPHIGHO2_02_FULL_53_13]
MNILICGGAGYVGGALTDALVNTDHTMRIFDALLFEPEYLKPVDFVRGDIRDHEALQPHLDWADAVVWLCALVADGACDLYSELAVELNQTSVQWLARHFDGRIVFPSTCLVYALQNKELTEEDHTAPNSLYVQTKLEAEKILQNHNALIFRLSTLFGLGDTFSRPRLDLVTNLLTARAVIDGTMTVFGGTQYRPLLHVRDVADAMVCALEADATGVYNIASENRTILDIAETIARLVPGSRMVVQEADVKTTGDYRVSCAKVRRDLGFAPTRSVEDGIKEMRDFISGGRLKDINHPRYNNAAYLKAYGHGLGES